ncbi:MAG: hypothetical protein C5B56_09620 [Proteobacteria bacterium]|jgi:hypothetical protein|nr:MAG: hypothetical protein C5B56_09620 [Pseudomonadota bacterium]
MVPPGEREAYLRFIAALQHQDELARSLAIREPLETRDPSTAAEPLEIAELEIKLLDPGLEGSGRDRK